MIKNKKVIYSCSTFYPRLSTRNGKRNPNQNILYNVKYQYLTKIIIPKIKLLYYIILCKLIGPIKTHFLKYIIKCFKMWQFRKYLLEDSLKKSIIN